MDNLRINFLNITNQQPHPDQKGYEIYYFRSREQADHFEELLKEKELFYERDEQRQSSSTIFLFGVKTKDIEKIDPLNYLALGRFRKPMIADKNARWVVVFIGLGLLVFALIGFILSNRS
jgi:hypothetical protein